MRTAPRAAAWAAWAAWICNRAIAGGAAAGNDWLQSQESGLRPALFLCARQGALSWRWKSSTYPTRANVSCTARASGATRSLKEAEGKSLARRTGSGWRRHCGVSRQKDAKPDTCTEHGVVDPTRISRKEGA